MKPAGYTQRHVDFIMDNLLAEKKAKPIIGKNQRKLRRQGWELRSETT
jgi:hypothetical protein